MSHLPYMDVYFNLPISKTIHIYIQIKDWFLYVDNFWTWEIKVDIHVGKIKHKNNCDFYLLYLTRSTSSVRLIAIKLHWYVLKMH